MYNKWLIFESTRVFELFRQTQWDPLFCYKIWNGFRFIFIIEISCPFFFNNKVVRFKILKRILFQINIRVIFPFSVQFLGRIPYLFGTIFVFLEWKGGGLFFVSNFCMGFKKVLKINKKLFNIGKILSSKIKL